MDKRTELHKGIKQFNRGDYFECHETLEEIWMVESGRDRRFYQGLLQLSVGFFHLFNSNPVGAASQWEKGVTKLKAYGDSHFDIDLTRLLEQVRLCQKMLEMVQSGSRQRFDVSLIPQIVCAGG